jgi:hypothetical protein
MLVGLATIDKRHPSLRVILRQSRGHREVICREVAVALFLRRVKASLLPIRELRCGGAVCARFFATITPPVQHLDALYSPVPP